MNILAPILAQDKILILDVFSPNSMDIFIIHACLSWKKDSIFYGRPAKDNLKMREFGFLLIKAAQRTRGTC